MTIFTFNEGKVVLFSKNNVTFDYYTFYDTYIFIVKYFSEDRHHRHI